MAEGLQHASPRTSYLSNSSLLRNKFMRSSMASCIKVYDATSDILHFRFVTQLRVSLKFAQCSTKATYFSSL